MNCRPHITILCLLAALPAPALPIRGYLPATHDRLTGFPATPLANPTFLFNASLFTGLAWEPSERQLALLSRRHIICASHWPMNPGEQISFLASDGSIVTRTVSARTNLRNPDNTVIDLAISTLSTPVMPSDGVTPFPYLNLASESDYIGKSLMVFGKTVRAGSGTIASFEDLDGPWYGRAFKFIYQISSGGPDDAYFELGDSSSPSFVLTNGVPAFVGIHSSLDGEGDEIWNFDVFVPHYAAKIDTLMAPLGYRMRPVHITPATLGVTTTPTPTTLRRGNPGDLLIEITNNGSETTGNLELTLSFPAGTEPDTVTAPDWIVETGGTGTWLLRRATLTSSETRSLTASWAALPLDPALAGSLDHLSDTSPAGSATIDTSLAPSFAEWESQTGVSGLTGDPDFDDLDNLLEYALGGDPLSGTLLLDGQHPLTLQIAVAAGTATISFPIRTDASLRGLSYIVEWSPDLENGPWSTTPPPGSTTTDQDWNPTVTGFQRRGIEWPATTGPLFARLRIELDEGT